MKGRKIFRKSRSPVFASSSVGSLKPWEYHWNYTFYGMTTRKIFIGPQIRAVHWVWWREGFSLFVIFITSNQVRVTSKPDKDLSFLPTWIMQLTPSSVVLLLFFLIIPDTPWLIPCYEKKAKKMRIMNIRVVFILYILYW